MAERNLYLLSSNAQPDARLRDELVKHLEGPALRGAVVCHDGRMPFNEHRDTWRVARLREADLVLVLLSTDLRAQGLYDLFEREVLPLGRPVLPVLLRPMNLDGTYFAGRRLLCEDGGLAGLSGDAAKQEAYVGISKEVQRLLSDKSGGQGPADSEDREDNDEGLEQVLRRKLPLGDPVVLECDRTRQWQDMLDAAGRPGHEVLLLPGGSTEGHLFFLMRARLCLPTPRTQREPPAALGLPYYHPRPEHKADFRAALAGALRCGEEQIRSRLRRRLQARTLVLVPEVHHGSGSEDDGALVECLTRWLPELLAEVGDVPHGLKWVQGLSYYAAPAWQHVMARWIGLPPKAAQRVRIDRLCDRLLREQHSGVRVIRLDPLDRIRAADILEYAEKKLLMDPARRQEFLQKVTSDIETSEGILKMIETTLGKDRR